MMPGPFGCTADTRDTIKLGVGASVRYQFGVRLHFGRVDLQQRHLAFAVAPGERLLVLLDEAVPPELLDHELHAIALPVLVVAVLLEHDQQRFTDAEQLGRRA